MEWRCVLCACLIWGVAPLSSLFLIEFNGISRNRGRTGREEGRNVLKSALRNPLCKNLLTKGTGVSQSEVPLLFHFGQSQWPDYKNFTLFLLWFTVFSQVYVCMGGLRAIHPPHVVFCHIVFFHWGFVEDVCHLSLHESHSFFYIFSFSPRLPFVPERSLCNRKHQTYWEFKRKKGKGNLPPLKNT